MIIKTKKRIVHVSSELVPIPPIYGGAVETYIYGISKFLSKMNYEVHIITVGQGDKTYIKNNIIYHTFNFDTTLGKFSSNISSLINRPNRNLLYSTYKILCILRMIWNKYGPIDFIYTHYFTTSIAPILYRIFNHRNIELIHHYHNEPKSNIDDKWIAKNYTSLWAVSNYIKKQAAKCLNLDENKIYVMYNAVNINEFCFKEEFRSEIRKKYGISKEENVLLYTGRIIPKKGLHIIVEALPQVLKYIEKVKLLVVGPLGQYWNNERAYFNKIMEFAAKKGIEDRIIYAGFFKPGLEVSKYYSASDVFVFPSFFNEACPSVILEAMSCSLPIVSHEVGAVAELMGQRNTGLLVKPGDVNAFADGIIEVLSSSKYVNNEGRQRVLNEFSFSRITKKIHEIYTKI